jgi:hypothetical protein
LAALVSFPYSHQVRYHGVFAGRSRMRRLLPPPPQRQEVLDIEATAPAPPALDAGKGTDTQVTKDAPSSALRRRLPWAQLLRRVLHVNALSCPRCSTALRSVPMVVLAFLTDPAVVERILRHLGLPHGASAPAPARSSPWQPPHEPLPPPLLTADLGVRALEEKALPILRPTHLATRPQDATPSSGHHREMRRPGRQEPTGLTEPRHPGLHLAGNHEHQPPHPPAEIQDPARRETFALENPIQLLAEPRTENTLAFASGAPLSSLAAIRRGVQHARGRSKFL